MKGCECEIRETPVHSQVTTHTRTHFTLLLENFATAQLALALFPARNPSFHPLRCFHTTHPQCSALRCFRCARHSQQSQDHNIFVAHVDVVQRAHTLGRLSQCHSTINLEHFRSSIVLPRSHRMISTGPARQHPCVLRLLQSVP